MTILKQLIQQMALAENASSVIVAAAHALKREPNMDTVTCVSSVLRTYEMQLRTMQRIIENQTRFQSAAPILLCNDCPRRSDLFPSQSEEVKA